MNTITTIGLDIAKFQAHGVDTTGQVVIRRCSIAPSWSSSRGCHPAWVGSRLERTQLSELCSYFASTLAGA